MFSDSETLLQLMQQQKGVLEETVSALPGGVAVYRFGREFEVLYSSKRLPELTGHTMEEYQKRIQEGRLQEGVFADDCAHVQEAIRQAAAAGKPMNVTFRANCRGGGLIWLEMSGKKIDGDSAAPVYYVIYTKPTEEVVQYRQLVSDSSIAVLVVSEEDGSILYANPKMNGILDTAPNDSVIGRHISEFDTKRIVWGRENAPYPKLTEEYAEFHARGRAGEYYLVTGKKMRWCGQAAGVYYFADETSEYRIQEERRKMLENLPVGIGIYEITEKGAEVKYLNNGYFRILGLHPDEWKQYPEIGTGERLQPEEANRLNAMCRTIFDGEEYAEARYCVQIGERTVWMHLRAAVIERRPDRVTIYVNFSDVAKEKQLWRTEFFADNIAGGMMGGYKEEGFPLYFINRHMLKLLGYDSEKAFVQATGGRLENAIYPQDRRYLMQQVDVQLPEKGEYTCEYRMRRQDGSLIWVRSTGKQIRAENGRDAIMCACANITELKEANRNFRDLIENVDCGMVLFRVERGGEISMRYFSRGFCRMCGLSEEEVERKFAQDSMYGVEQAYREEVTALFHRTAATGRPQEITYRTKLPQDEVRWVTLKLTRSKNEDGSIGVYCVFLDATGQVEARRSADFAAQRYKNLYDNVDCGIYEYEMTDNEIRFLSINAAGLKLFGYTEKEFWKLSGWPTENCIHGDDLAEMQQKLNGLSTVGDIVSYTYRMRRRDNSYIWVRGTARLTEKHGDTRKIESVCMNVDTLKRTEHELATEQEKVDALLDCAKVAFWEFSPLPEPKIRTISKSSDIAAVNDISPEEIVERGIIHPDSAKDYLEMYRKILQGAAIAEATVRRENLNGDYRWMRMTMKRVNSGDTERILGWCIDVHQTVEAHAKLEKEIRYQEDMSAQNLIAKGRFNITDNLVEKFFAPNGDEALCSGDNYSEKATTFIYSAATEAQQTELAKMLERGQVLSAFARGEQEMSAEYQHLLPSGRQKWTRMAVRLYKDYTSGKVMSFLYVYDIDNEKRCDIMYRSLTRAVYEYVAYVDLLDGTFHTVIMDQTIPAMPGTSGDDFEADVRRTFTEELPPEDRKVALRNLSVEGIRKNLKDREKFQFLLQIRHADGSIHIKQITMFYMDRTEEHAILTCEDVTEQLRKKDASTMALSRALEAANQGSREKSKFLSRVSHEIRTPINAILGMAELGRQDVMDGDITPETLLNYFEETANASKYLLTLVNDILDTGRVENGRMELNPAAVNANDFLADLLAMTQPMADEKGIKLEFKRKTHFRSCYVCDRVRVKQIIVNLLNNAIKFTPSGGSVRLVSEAVDETPDTTTLRFTVADNGIGMTEEFQKNLFQPFAQENSEITSPFAGTGLGLNIVRALARKMGGDVTCRSKKGVGTTFVVTIKAGNAPDEECPETTVRTADAVWDFGGIHILLCEDHPLNQKITRALLERADCKVEIAADGAAGVRAFAESPENDYAMILMDVRMPIKDGLQAAAEIRSLARADAATVPIVAMSANAYEEDVQKSITAGMNAHLAKPVDAVQLYRTIDRYTRQGRMR